MQPPESASHRMFSLITGFRATQLVRVAVELGLPELVGTEPVGSAALAAATGTDAPSLHRALRALAALGVLEQTSDGGFVGTPLSRLLRRDAPGSLADLALGLPAEGYASWGSLSDVLRTGEPAYPRLYGRSYFEALADDPASAELFNRTMTSGTIADAAALVAAIDLPERGTVIDVGGGNGALLAAVLRARPQLNGILLDRAAGLAGAPAHLSGAGVLERCQLVEGDFFEAVPTADLYLLKRVLHDWDDERALAILAACARGMAPGARLLVMEMLVPERAEAGYTAERVTLLDLNMLVLLGGRERTAAEYADLLERAGLRLARTIATARPASVIEAVQPEG